MYKLVAVDLDGTLLNSYGEITEETKKSIKKAKEKGVEIVISSGRPIDSIKEIAKEIESENYFIAGNGAIIYDIKKDEIIYKNYINKEKVLEIIKVCEENSISYNLYTEKMILAKALKYNVLYYHKENSKKEENKKMKIMIVENMYEYVSNLKDEKFVKITICDDTKSIFDSIIKKIKQIEKIDILDVSHMSRKTIKQGEKEVLIEYFYTEISANNVDKWYAIEYLAKKLNIKENEIIAIGDNINDKKMIEKAGIGVAIEGATPEITKIADFITKSNNENGVGEALKKIIFN